MKTVLLILGLILLAQYAFTDAKFSTQDTKEEREEQKETSKSASDK